MRYASTREADSTADPVCEFYTHHPYPPPVENLDRARDEWRDANRHRAEHHLLWPDQPYRANLDILVAGCGTWQAAKYAVCRPAARVAGIDVSATSLVYTERLKRKYQLANLETRQLRIEDAETLDRRFDLIVCTGVLHHLGDPDAGLRALRSVMKVDGAMLLMVYGRYGRVGIDMLQEYCRRLGIGSSREEIDDLAAALAMLPAHHPAAALLHRARDSADRDALADALLNPRDRSYSVPELFDFVERNGCVVGRWQMQAPYLPQCGAIAATAHAARLAGLREREQYAAMELWRGTIAHHSAVIYRSDSHPFAAAVRFDDERWPSYVPIRLPGTICVRERLPASAAVLLNRGHLHHDLIVPVDDEELRMYAAIDGRRTIAAIAKMAAVTGDDGTWPRARTFFEKLWGYDQVVFDATEAASERSSTP
jgi:SAM-dependent methyltransferase